MNRSYTPIRLQLMFGWDMGLGQFCGSWLTTVLVTTVSVIIEYNGQHQVSN